MTNGGLLSGREPLFAMAGGIARGLKTERPALQIATLDLDQRTSESLPQDCELIWDIFLKVCATTKENYSLEYRKAGDIIYRNTLQTDDDMNQESVSRKIKGMANELVAMEKPRHTPLELSLDSPGVMSTMFFQPDQSFDSRLPEDSVQVSISAAGVSSNVSIRDILIHQ